MKAASSAARRKYDIVLYGASGFVGRQTVAYIAAQPEVRANGLRWALAGRNREKLEQVRAEAGAAAAAAGIVVARADDRRSLGALARNAGVVLSTAGPFDLYGSRLVAACVEHRTHYVDITGETPWASGLITRHHAQAAANGTRIIPFCGFDSVPSDLGAWLLTRAMQQRHDAPCVDVKAAFSMRGGLNGGTLASAMNMLGSGQALLMADPYLLNPPEDRPADRLSDADPVLPHYDSDFKAWVAPFVMGPINTRVVRRSACLLDYGRDFHYQEYLRAGDGVVAGLAAVSLCAAMGLSRAAMGLAPLRRLAASVAPKPGQGPSQQAMDNGSFRCELVGHSTSGKTLRARVAGRGDPGNRSTTRMVCEAALCLALEQDRLPGGRGYGGVLTPASGLGEVLVERLRTAGVTLEVQA